MVIPIVWIGEEINSFTAFKCLRFSDISLSLTGPVYFNSNTRNYLLFI